LALTVESICDAFLVDVAEDRGGVHSCRLLSGLLGMDRQIKEAVLVWVVVERIGVVNIHKVRVSECGIDGSRGFGAEHGEVDPVVEHVSCTFDLVGDLVVHGARVEFAGHNALYAVDECSEGVVPVQTRRKFADCSLDLAQFKQAAQDELDD
jgi:hypothetical protein